MLLTSVAVNIASKKERARSSMGLAFPMTSPYSSCGVEHHTELIWFLHDET
jgi:hypothetical protein